MVSPIVFARRSLSYLMSEMPQEALNNASQAQVISPMAHCILYASCSSFFTWKG
ncbi:hypothetical protein RchiOBHm_Chr1g0324601 [Rosa chinensis]|uniref:Serine/threonine-protein kinase BSK1-like TPR repeats domain-containing protein n=1 Tax=Rosa chinensis TaxID=74649 RepID=A0A2P6S9R9_ROSCH|nr:hypothetical protein RchiOBHm_Chr1g0324601 [Rosa chinensis]